MQKKPDFDLSLKDVLEKRVLKAKKELLEEENNKPKITPLCLNIETDLLFSIKKIALNRKIQGKKTCKKNLILIYL
jgi:hypothetical protein